MKYTIDDIRDGFRFKDGANTIWEVANTIGDFCSLIDKRRVYTIFNYNKYEIIPYLNAGEWVKINFNYEVYE